MPLFKEHWIAPVLSPLVGTLVSLVIATGPGVPTAIDVRRLEEWITWWQAHDRASEEPTQEHFKVQADQCHGHTDK